MIRFHLDQHIPMRVALALRRRGVDVTIALEVGLAAAADSDHLKFAHGKVAWSSPTTEISLCSQTKGLLIRAFVSATPEIERRAKLSKRCCWCINA